jgi:hypothetical protein
MLNKLELFKIQMKGHKSLIAFLQGKNFGAFRYGVSLLMRVAGICAGEVRFSSSIRNVTVTKGRDASLSCTVEGLGNHKVGNQTRLGNHKVRGSTTTWQLGISCLNDTISCG